MGLGEKLGEKLMKVVVKVGDVVRMARRFEESPLEAMREMVTEVREGFRAALERVMDTEISLFLGQAAERGNKRNGYTVRTFGVHGLGTLQVRVPRDRAGRFASKVVPEKRRYDEAIEKDLALLHLAGLSTRMLSMVSRRVLGVRVSAQEVSNSLGTIVPAAKAFLDRSLEGRRFKYLWVDGTNFHVRRTTVGLEPTLVVIGVDEADRKSVLAMVQGDKERRACWDMVFSSLKERGLDGTAVRFGVMDGLPGLVDAFVEAFPKARAGRCWVHKARNVFPRVPTRYQAEFKPGWDAMQYAESRAHALAAFKALEERWAGTCDDALDCIRRDLEELLAHYELRREHWEALRTTNPIERVNKEFKRRSKAMETIGPDGLKALLAFTASEAGVRVVPDAAHLEQADPSSLPGEAGGEAARERNAGVDSMKSGEEIVTHYSREECEVLTPDTRFLTPPRPRPASKAVALRTPLDNKGACSSV
jgi:transposase-like protein